MSKVAFIMNNKVFRVGPIGAVLYSRIAKRRLTDKWQAILPCLDEVEAGWDYNTETEELTPP